VTPQPEIVHISASSKLHDAMENSAVLRGCCSRQLPSPPPSPLPATLTPALSRAIVINCLAIREPQNDAAAPSAGGVHPAAASNGAAAAEAGHASAGQSHAVSNDTSEQRFRLAKQLPEISVRVRR
jgi:hypothetical protein